MFFVAFLLALIFSSTIQGKNWFLNWFPFPSTDLLGRSLHSLLQGSAIQSTVCLIFLLFWKEASLIPSSSFSTVVCYQQGTSFLILKQWVPRASANDSISTCLSSVLLPALTLQALLSPPLHVPSSLFQLKHPAYLTWCIILLPAPASPHCSPTFTSPVWGTCFWGCPA